MRRYFWWCPGGLVALLILSATLGPLAALLKQPEIVSVLLWQDSYLVHVAWFSLKQATLSTVLSLALAIPMARALFTGNSRAGLCFYTCLVYRRFYR